MLRKLREMDKKILIIALTGSVVILGLFFKMIISLIPIIAVAILGWIGYKLYKKGY